MTLDLRGFVEGGGAKDPESRHRILGHAVCCTGTGFALPCLKIPYKQPLAEQYVDT